ncbi:MAG: hypothetical protein LLG04_04700 [Parachlamydia sp.]|nr:hypothetical protein [Parachlamydia sp.]
MGKSVEKSQTASPAIPSVPHVPPVLRIEPAEPIPAIYQRAGVVFAAFAFACATKVIERTLKYDSDQFYDESPKLNAVLLAVVGVVVISQIFLHMRNRG